MEIKRTTRGFAYAEFHDYDCDQCSIQESSIATEYLLWLGRDLNESGVDGAYRMHLTQRNAAEHWPLLRRFAETGRLTEDE